MISNYNKENKTLTLKVTEEIDQHTSDKIRRKLDSEIELYNPRKVIFDFENITFMDSSGIGMILGRYKLTKILGGEFELINVNRRLKRIFDMSGVSKIIKINNINFNQKEGINEEVI